MKAVGQEAAAGDGKGGGRGSAGIGEVAREGVAGVEGEPLAAMAGDLGRTAVVIAFSGIHDALDHGPVGIGTVAAGLGIADGIGRHLVEVLHGFKVPAMAAGVREAHADAVAQILLQSQVPLLD